MGRTIILVAALALAAVLAASCGSDASSGPRVLYVLEAEEVGEVDDLDDALDAAVEIIERRIDAFDFEGGSVRRADGNRIFVELPAPGSGEAIEKIGTTALLQFCEPVTNATGDVATARDGTVTYEPRTCQPARDADGNIIVSDGGTIQFVPWAHFSTPQAGDNPSAQRIVWQPAVAEIDGVEIEFTGRLLRANTFVTFEPIFNQPILQFEMTSEGREVLEQITERLVERNYPLAPFLDGEPVLDHNGLPIAPTVEGVISTGGQIGFLDPDEAEELATLLNTGALPFSLRVVEVREVTE